MSTLNKTEDFCPPFLCVFLEIGLEFCVLRNFFIIIRSSVIPLIFSYRPTIFSEALTVDMLNSLEIILENEKTLEFFEKFLKNEPNFLQKDSGYSLLCFYKEITCRLQVSIMWLFQQV